MAIDIKKPNIESAFKIAHQLELLVAKKSSKMDTIICDSHHYTCDICGNTTNFIHDDVMGEVICGNCGLVLDEKMIDEGKEWRAFDHGEEMSKARAGSKYNQFVYDRGLSTIIDGSYKDCNGNSLSPFARRLQERLKRAQKRSYRKNEDRNFSDAMNYLSSFSEMFSLTKKTKEQIAADYRKIVKSQALKGRTIKNILLALIYIHCAKNKRPIPISEIKEKGNISESDLMAYKKKVYKALKMKVVIITPKDYLNTIHRSLKIEDDVLLVFAKFLYDKYKAIDPVSIQGKDPLGVAAGVYYLACLLLKYDCAQQQIKDLFHITDITIRNRYKEACHAIFDLPEGGRLIPKLRSIISHSKENYNDLRNFVASYIYR